MTQLKHPLNTVVLLGGKSPEREVSLQSGNAVAQGLRAAGHRVRLLDPALQSVLDFDWDENAIAVIMLHGTYGEDGQVQSQLDSLGVLYTGSGEQSSRQAFQKHTAKEIFAQSQLPTPSWKIVPQSANENQLTEAAAAIGYPLVVKPDAQGSSIGVSIVPDSSELWKSFEVARELDQFILLEKAIIGEEWTVPILDQHPLPAIRIVADRTFFDYTAKYEDDQTQYEVIMTADCEIAARVTDLSLKACEALKTAGVCRVDIMVDEAGQPWLLEVNTLPGMTDHSLVPKAARCLGWTMQNLCERILLSALANRCS